MIPLRDNIPSQRFPLATLLVIFTCAGVFFYQLSLGKGQQHLFFTAGLIPKKFFMTGLVENSSLVGSVAPLFSHMFLHGGWMHIIGNMWMLWIFGDNVEEAMGRGRFLMFYILCGLLAGLFHLFTNEATKTLVLRGR